MAIRVSPLLFRRIHKWVGLILGIQFVLWTVSGAMMALINHHDAMGEHLGHPPKPAAWPTKSLPPSELQAGLGDLDIVGMSLRPMLDFYVYEITTPAGVHLVDAASGNVVAVTGELAKTVAAADYAGDADVARVTRLAEPNLETREHDEPVWRVDFADEAKTSFYVSEATGKILERRNDTFRLRDFFWMLHNMDYANRASFNHPLIIFVAFGTLWLSMTGFYLLFKSFKRADFRWLRRSSTRNARAGAPAE